jgi:hypothetical protein
VLLAAAAIAVLPFGAVRTRARFAAIADRYCLELGQVIAAHCDPDTMLLTCENDYDPLRYYANHAISGKKRDEDLVRAGNTLPADFGDYRYFVIPEQPFSPHAHVKLLALLSATYQEQVVATRACGKVHIFDLRQKQQ